MDELIAALLEGSASRAALHVAARRIESQATAIRQALAVLEPPYPSDSESDRRTSSSAFQRTLDARAILAGAIPELANRETSK